MGEYIACLCCEKSLAPADVCLKVTHLDKVVGGVCSTCMTDVRTFKISFTKDSKTSPYAPMHFQCLEAFTVPRNADIEP